MGKKILVVVDVQYDFCNPNGALFVPGGEVVVDKVKDIIPNFDYVIFTKDSHSLNHCSFKENGGIWPVHCVWNSIGEGIPVELLKAAKDYGVVAKGGNVDEEEYGAFSDDMEFFYNIEFAVDSEGNEITDEESLIGSYMVIKLIIDEQVYDEKTIAVRGDLSGEGIITVADITIGKNIILGKVEKNIHK